MIRPKYLIFVLAFFLCAEGILAQDAKNAKQSVLVNTYEWLGSDDASAMIDFLRMKMDKTPESTGLIIVYCGKRCSYGEVEAHIRGVRESLKLKGVDDTKIGVIPGGFREKTMTEYYVMPEGACPPLPKSTIDIEKVVFEGKFKRNIVHYECC